MPRRRIDITGQRFGRLVVTGYEGYIRKESMYRVHCDCGQDFVTHGKSLRKGLTRSCGCLNREVFMSHRTEVQPGTKRGHYITKKSRKQNEQVHIQ